MELRVIFTRQQLDVINASDIHNMVKLWLADYPQADEFAEGMIANMRMAAFMEAMIGDLNGDQIKDEVSADIYLPDSLILDIKEDLYPAFKFVKEEPMPVFGMSVTIRLMKPET